MCIVDEDLVARPPTAKELTVAEVLVQAANAGIIAVGIRFVGVMIPVFLLLILPMLLLGRAMWRRMQRVVA